MKFLKKHLSSLIFGIIFLIGLGLLAYPTFSNWWNSWNAARVGEVYDNTVNQMNKSKLKEIKEAADSYNQELLSNSARFHPSEEEHSIYLSQLSLDDSVMGLIEIPEIKVKLPIYHGTEDSVLASGSGHLEGSSLPVGGLGTHTVITGHRGLPSAKLFTDLDQLTEGDYVILKVLQETLTYQIDQINIVLPDEVENLRIDPDKDQLTLITCTPYGVNSHRMLLTGHRVENLKDYEVTAEAKMFDTKIVALFIAIPILIGLFIWLVVRYRKPKE